MAQLVPIDALAPREFGVLDVTLPDDVDEPLPDDELDRWEGRGVSHLVDTHVLLWLLADPGRVPEEVRRRLADRTTGLVVSAVSALEIATKVRLDVPQQMSSVSHGSATASSWRSRLGTPSWRGR